MGILVTSLDGCINTQFGASALIRLSQRAENDKCALSTQRLSPVLLAHSLRGQQSKEYTN